MTGAETRTPEKQGGASARTAVIAATVGVVVILGLALFVGLWVVPFLETRAAVKDFATIGLFREGDIDEFMKRLGGPDRSVERLQRYLDMPDWAAPRKDYAAGLLALSGARGIRGLIRALDSDNTRVRIAAAYGLGLIGPGAGEAIPRLTGSLEDGDWRVRRQAAWALGVIVPDAEEVIAALEKTLNDENESVRQAATEALRNIRGDVAEPPQE